MFSKPLIRYGCIPSNPQDVTNVRYACRSTSSLGTLLRAMLVSASSKFVPCISPSWLVVLAALRASLGHPEPFTLRFVEIGNEVSTGTCPLSWLALALAPPRNQISFPNRHAITLSTTGFHQQLGLLNVSSTSQCIIRPFDSDHVSCGQVCQLSLERLLLGSQRRVPRHP